MQPNKTGCAKSDYAHVTPHVYIGNADAGHDDALLRQLNVSLVLSISSADDARNSVCAAPRLRLVGESDAFAQGRVAGLDNAIEAAAAAVRAGRVVFIHCRRGHTRSAMCVVRLLREVYGMETPEAFELLMRVRPCVHRAKFLMALTQDRQHSSP
jgi:hypothetical protein